MANMKFALKKTVDKGQEDSPAFISNDDAVVSQTHTVIDTAQDDDGPILIIPDAPDASSEASKIDENDHLAEFRKLYPDVNEDQLQAHYDISKSDPELYAKILKNDFSSDDEVSDARATPNDNARPGEATENSTSPSSESEDENKAVEEEEFDEAKVAEIIFQTMIRNGVSEADAKAKVEDLKEKNQLGSYFQEMQARQNQARMQQQKRPQEEGRAPGYGGGGLFRGLAGGAATGLRNKIIQHRHNSMATNLVNFKHATENFEKSIAKANHAFMETDGGKALKDLAVQAKMDYKSYVAGVASGEIKNNLARIAFKEAVSNPEFKSAIFDVNNDAKGLRNNANAAANSMRKLANSGIDVGSRAQELADIVERARNVDNPLSEDPKKFKETMDKMLENVRKMVDRLVSTISKALKM